MKGATRRLTGVFAVGVAIAVCACLSFGVAPAAAAGLDESFGRDGIMLRDLGKHDAAETIAGRSDGSFVVAGEIYLPRDKSWAIGVFSFRPNGRIDRSFGNRGRRVIPRPGDEEGPTVVFDDRGRIVVAFGADASGESIGVARLNRGGDLDRGFDRDGVQTVGLDPGTETYGYFSGTAGDVTVTRDDRIVVVGSALGESGGSRFGAVQLRPDGSLDPDFGVKGRASVDVAPGAGESASSVAIDASGRIILGGAAYGEVASLAVARLEADGSPDLSFSGDGTAQFGEYPAATDIAVEADGSIVLAGAQQGDFSVVSIDATGEPRSSFGEGGISRIDFEGGADRAAALAMSDGSILLAGTATTESRGQDLGVAALRRDGSLDADFGAEGRLLVDFGSRRDEGLAIAPVGQGFLAGASVRILDPRDDLDVFDSGLAKLRAP